MREDLSDAEFADAFYDMSVDIALLQVLEQARKALNVSEKELAERMGVQRSTVTRLFNASHPNPTLDTIAEYLRDRVQSGVWVRSIEQACHGGTLYSHALGKFFLTDIEGLAGLFKHLKQGNVYAHVVEGVCELWIAQILAQALMKSAHDWSSALNLAPSFLW